MERRLRKLKKKCAFAQPACVGFEWIFTLLISVFFFEGRGGLLVLVIVIDSCFKNNHFLSSLVIERCAKLRV